MDRLDLLEVIGCIEIATFIHLRVSLVSPEPFFECLGLFIDVNSGVLGLFEQFANLARVLLVLKCHIVIVAI